MSGPGSCGTSLVAAPIRYESRDPSVNFARVRAFLRPEVPVEQPSNKRSDRRLTRRRDFAAGEQLEKELRGLPDVADKGELVDSPQFPVHAQPAVAGSEAD